LWHYFGGMPRVFSKSASNGQVQEHASASKSTASDGSASLPVPAAGAKPVVCSGTARELRRLKRKARLATDRLPESSAAIASALSVTLTKAPAAGSVEEWGIIATVGDSYPGTIQEAAQHAKGNNCSKRQILKQASDYYLAMEE
jgi:hypothetical protein